ncbi:MAG: oligoendopeptidase F [candidate division Zixibacteria bacterium]|nr:oligoendopeptidase F [candidate division Zixibacteria bacterium]
MAETAKDVNTIPQRDDIDAQDTWALTDLYKDDNEWDSTFSKAQKLAEKAGEFSGHLDDSSKNLYNCLEARTELSMICDELYQYAKLNQDLDSRASKYQEMCDRAVVLASKISAAFSFVEPELLQIEESKLTEMAKAFPKPDVYDFYISDFNRSRSHIRSAEVEELLAQSSVISRSPHNIFSMFDAADIVYPEVADDNGHKVRLTKQRFAKFMDSPKQSVRAEANEKFYKPYISHLNTLGAVFSATIAKDTFYSKARKYESALHASLDSNNIPVSVYHSLIKATENNLTGLHKYMSVRKKLLKLEKHYPYDVFCPLFPEANDDIPYEEAVKEVLSAIKPLGDNYTSHLTDGFSKRWIDVYETEGKAGGAYSWRNYRSHPFVLMNYNNTISNMFTLAHEMGHAMHSFLSNQKQSYQKAQYSIFVAEVASTLNEGLLMHYLLGKTTDKSRRMYLINRQLTGAMGTYFHQVMYANFEFQVHDIVEKGGALSPDIMNKIWANLTTKYYGSSVTMDEYSKYKWSRIPHFYTNFYVYQYATSYAASQAILGKFLSGEKGIIEKYLNLISSGGNDYPINQLKICGVDMTTTAPFDATLKQFENLVDEMSTLAEEG